MYCMMLILRRVAWSRTALKVFKQIDVDLKKYMCLKNIFVLYDVVFTANGVESNRVKSFDVRSLLCAFFFGKH